MKLISPLPTRRGRLEIIPLIDIMFFLLAAFMIVSINKIRVKSLKVSLPTKVPAATLEKKEDFIAISVNAAGQVQVDKTVFMHVDDLLSTFQNYYQQNPNQKFLLSGDSDCRYGDLMRVLGKLRAAGFQRIAEAVKPDEANSGPHAQMAPAGSPAAAAETAPASPSAPTPTAAGLPPTSTAAPVPVVAPRPIPSSPEPLPTVEATPVTGLQSPSTTPPAPTPVPAAEGAPIPH